MAVSLTKKATSLKVEFLMARALCFLSKDSESAKAIFIVSFI